jgi:lipopolysaccharide export LptBFGC system permease protein LptF
MKRLLFGLIMVFGFFHLANGQQGSQSKDADWVKIGQTTINLSEDYGIFDWDRDREQSINANDKYSAIKFRAKDANVNLSNVEVQYDNGKKEDFKLGSSISANSDSKQLKLDTREDLDKVTINFMKDQNAPKDKKAVVEVWGLKDQSSGMGKRDVNVNVDIDTTHKHR